MGVPGRVTHQDGQRISGFAFNMTDLPDPLAKAVEQLMEGLQQLEMKVDVLKNLRENCGSVSYNRTQNDCRMEGERGIAQGHDEYRGGLSISGHGGAQGASVSGGTPHPFAPTQRSMDLLAKVLGEMAKESEPSGGLTPNLSPPRPSPKSPGHQVAHRESTLTRVTGKSCEQVKG